LKNLHIIRKVFLLFLGLLGCYTAFSVDVSDVELQKIGQKIFWNECSGNPALLTNWKYGEDFGSFGFGHFIWYPEGKKGIHEERFPRVLAFFKANKVELPDFLQPDKPCPWKTRDEFYNDYDSEKMIFLRKLLKSTMSLQAKFMANNLEIAILKIKEAASPEKKQMVEKILNSMLHSSSGLYILIDYVNFKGNGTNPSERYNGQGWGLLQVIENMKDSNNNSDIIKNFAQSAKFVLQRRANNSPNKTQEQKWIPGWFNRIDTYTAQ